MISTPETGVDSIALTYSLMDPIITVIRPIAAFLTALTAGVVENFLGKPRAGASSSHQLDDGGQTGGCGCESGNETQTAVSGGFRQRAATALRFSFDELMGDLAPWLILGLLLAGVITALIPDSFVEGAFGTGVLGYLAMLAVGLPLYVCATMTTPVAAALVLKGMSPGAALVLLMAGPATNAATVAMVGGMLGKRALAIYLGAIVVCTLLFGFLTDVIYDALGVSAQATAGAAARELIPSLLEWFAALVLAILIARVVWKKGLTSFFSRPRAVLETSEKSPAGNCCTTQGSAECT